MIYHDIWCRTVGTEDKLSTVLIVNNSTNSLSLSFQGEISTLIALDREVRDNYVFTVQAMDNGQTPLSGYTSVLKRLDIRIPSNDYNWTFSYSPYWTGTSMQWRLMPGKIMKTTHISLSCKLVPVQYLEYGYGPLHLFFRPILTRLINWEQNEWMAGAEVQSPGNLHHPTLCRNGDR